MTPAVKAAKLPKAIFVVNDWHYCAILPFRSATEAREFCKAWSLPSNKVEEIANIIFDKAPYPHRCIRGKEHYRDIARTVLRALHFNTGEKA